MAVKVYRKRPIVIEAVQWTGKNVLEVYSFMHGKPDLSGRTASDKWHDFTALHEDKDWHIKTLEDGSNGEAKHVASVGDWIIKGVKGEFYPCKPDVFEATYEDALSVQGETKALDFAKELSLLRDRVAKLEGALDPFRSGGNWGRYKAWLTNGPPTTADGIRAAKQITEWQVTVDRVVALSRGDQS